MNFHVPEKSKIVAEEHKLLCLSNSEVSGPFHALRGEVTLGEKGAEVFKSNKSELHPHSHSVSDSSFVQGALR